MPDAQRIVDDLRSFVHASDQTFSEPLRALAADYAAACQEANKRLRRCDEFLRQGLRSEAIRFAEAEPPLLDLLAVLDFPERPQWAELAASYGLAAPPALRLETAEALNRAYAEEQPLEHLLKQHRRLALQQAPLPERIGVLRQIAATDPGNPVWAQDAATLEQVRLDQLDSEARQAHERDDFARLNAVWAEISSDAWVSPPARDLVARVQKLVRTRATQAARARLRVLTEGLEEAHAAMDVAAVRRLAEEWRRVRGELGPEDDGRLAHRAQPVLQWLARQDKLQEREFAFQAALDALERALADPETSEEALCEAYNRATQVNPEGVPARVEDAFQRRLTQLRRQESGRERLVLVITFAVGAVAVVGFLLFVLLR